MPKAKQKTNKPSLEELEHLYDAASKIKELAPWKWMYEDEIFGVQNPQTKGLGFISIMGRAGEHFAVGVYLGAEGLYGFWDMQEGALFDDPMALLDVPQLQASFEDREALDKRDRDEIKKLGLKFRGAKNWTQFRSMQSGCLPWHITAEEARFLVYALEQTLDVAPRVKENPELLKPKNEEDETYLVRVAKEESGKLVWRDEMMDVPAPEDEHVAFKIGVELINKLKAAPQKDITLEIEFTRAPSPVKDKTDARPYFPYMLLIADSRSGMILDMEMMRPAESQLKTYAQVPEHLIDILARLDASPKEIRVQNGMLFDMLEPLMQTMKIKVRETDKLPAIDVAMNGIFGFMLGRGF